MTLQIASSDITQGQPNRRVSRFMLHGMRTGSTTEYRLRVGIWDLSVIGHAIAEYPLLTKAAHPVVLVVRGSLEAPLSIRDRSIISVAICAISQSVRHILAYCPIHPGCQTPPSIRIRTFCIRSCPSATPVRVEICTDARLRSLDCFPKPVGSLIQTGALRWDLGAKRSRQDRTRRTARFPQTQRRQVSLSEAKSVWSLCRPDR
jgi:hypothetical protein